MFFHDRIFPNSYLNPATPLYDTAVFEGGAEIGNVTINSTNFQQIEYLEVYTGSGNDTIDASTALDRASVGAGAGNDSITGTNGIDYLDGGDGNDTINGGAGDDYLVGGKGSDTYLVDSIGDTVDESGGNGTDRVQSSTTYTLGTGLENLTLTGTNNIDGTGNTANNSITGNSGNNSLNGLGGNDTLNGGAGDDTLNGGAGIDTLVGSTGNDTYVVDTNTDTLTENAVEGTDTIQSSITFSLAALANVENITLTGTGNINATGNAGNNNLTGNSGNNTLTGDTGDDTLDGGAGIDTLVGGTSNDIYLVDTTTDTITENAAEGTDTIQSSVTFSLAALANVENLTLTGTDIINATGNASNNNLTGNSGNNTLDGAAGVDTLVGSTGNDTYIVDTNTDTITENAAEGNDTVQSSVTFSLAALANIENLTLTGTDIINATGNTSNNNLTGNSGNNILDGNAGIDTLVGSTGNDTYIVDTTTDTITENAAEGNDTVQSSVTFSLATLANVENLTLTGTDIINATGNASNNNLTGNSGNNTLDGGAGVDTLVGGTGNDTYVVNSTTDTITENAAEGTDTVKSSVTYTLGANLEKLTLTGAGNINATGNTSNNTLTGNNGNNNLNGASGKDTLNGGAGVDILTGGTGNDTFVFRFGQSTVSNPDAITDFAIGADKIDLLTQGGAATGSPTQFSRASDSAAATLTDVVNGVFADADGLTAGNQALAVNSAALVVVSTAGIAGTYLVINDPVAGFQSTVDSVVNISGYSGTLPSLGTIPVSNFFV